MDNLGFNKLLDKVILPEIIKTRQSGGQEYARSDENIFANFERVSKTLDILPEEVIMTYTLKHIDGIVAHIKGHVSQREDVRGRITDAAVYLFLLWAYIVKDEDSSTSIDDSTNSTTFEDYEKDQEFTVNTTSEMNGKKIDIPAKVTSYVLPEDKVALVRKQMLDIKKKGPRGCCGERKEKSKKKED